MAFDEYVTSNGERLRRGFTTGTCATLATKAAATLLLTGKALEEVAVMTPAGIEVRVAVEALEREGNAVRATIIKDAGDDFDVTHGTRVCAVVSACPEQGVFIDGGIGVGRVTCPGLNQPVGNAAINSGPRAMITAAAEAVMEESDYLGGLSVVIEVPDGEEIGRKTFNPSLGIEGGISILGTSGIVEPRSLKALQDALAVEIHFHAAAGHKRLIVTPGNYGEAFLKTMNLPAVIPIVSCANFIGFTLDKAIEEGFEELLLVGHIGKLVKVAGAIMDTHSRTADCRREIFAAHAAAAGANQRAILAMFDAMTTDACLDICQEAGVRDEVIARIASAIQAKIDHRVAENLKVGAVIFSNKTGLLATTPQANSLIEAWKTPEEQ